MQKKPEKILNQLGIAIQEYDKKNPSKHKQVESQQESFHTGGPKPLPENLTGPRMLNALYYQNEYIFDTEEIQDNQQKAEIVLMLIQRGIQKSIFVEFILTTFRQIKFGF